MPARKKSSKKPGTSTSSTSTMSVTSVSGTEPISKAIQTQKLLTTATKKELKKRLADLKIKASPSSETKTATVSTTESDKENCPPPAIQKKSVKPLRPVPRKRNLRLKKDGTFTKPQLDHLEFVRGLTPYEREKDKYQADLMLAENLLLLAQSERVLDHLELDLLLSLTVEDTPPRPAKKQRMLPPTERPPPMDVHPMVVRIRPVRRIRATAETIRDLANEILDECCEIEFQ